MVAVLSVVQIIISNQLSTTGISLGKTDDTIDAYAEENELLREKLLIATSFTQIASSASLLGFTDSRSQVVLTGSLRLAIKQ